MHKVLKCGILCAPMVIGAVLMIAACDQEWPVAWDGYMDTGQPDIMVDTGFDMPPDTSPDLPPDTTTDTTSDPGIDTTPPDTTPDTTPDPGVDTSGCTYPAGPWAYTRIGDTVGPASWPSAIQASAETFPSPTADFEDFFCDPDVESIVIFLATQS